MTGRWRHLHIFGLLRFLLSGVLLFCSPGAAAVSTPIDAIAVRCPGAPPLVVSLRDPEPTFEPAFAIPGGYKTSRRLYSSLTPLGSQSLPTEVVERLVIDDGALFWDGQHLELPRQLKMRDVWRAVMIDRWVVGVGRTSATDVEASSMPPFFASEGFVFRPGDSDLVLSSPLGAFPADANSLVLLRAAEADAGTSQRARP